MKLHIFGASGSGVTTLGQTLSEELQINYFDSDDYFWVQSEPPFTNRREATERNELILQSLNKSNDWILGGSVIHWSENLFPAFDLIVFLWIPPNIRIERLRNREFERYGNAILKDPVRAEQFNKFIEWAMDYDYNSGIANRTLQAHEDWLKKTKSPVLRISGDFTTEHGTKLVMDWRKEKTVKSVKGS